MLYNLLVKPGDVIMVVAAFVIVFGGLGAGIVFGVISIVKTASVRPSKVEKDRFEELKCPFTGENLRSKVLKDTSYYQEEKEEEKVRMKATGYGEYIVDTVKVKTGGWKPGNYKLVRYTAKTLEYTILEEYKKTEEYQEETSWKAEAIYDITSTGYRLENVGTLTKKQQKKLIEMCKKRSSYYRMQRFYGR